MPKAVFKRTVGRPKTPKISTGNVVSEDVSIPRTRIDGQPSAPIEELNGPLAVPSAPLEEKRAGSSPPPEPEEALPAPEGPPPEDLCPEPIYRRYLSDNSNVHARTNVFWKWWKELPDRYKNKVVAYVYRSYPPLLDPPENDKTAHKYIDVVSAPFDSDQSLCDRYGAGDYRIFVNIAEKKSRTLAECYVKGTRDFKSMPPSDRRITETDDRGRPKWIDVNDPQCRSYVEFLRSRGLMPEVWQQKKEDEMAEQADVLKTVLTMQKDLIDKATKKEESGTPLHETVGRVIDTAMSGARAGQEILKETIQTLQEQLSKGNGNQGSAEMMNVALQIAQVISKQSDPTAYMQIIAKLNETVAGLQLDRLNDKIESLRSVANPAGSPTSSLKSLIEDFKSMQELMGDGAGGTTGKIPAWLPLVTSAMEPVSRMVGNITQAFIASRMQPTIVQAPMQPAPPPAGYPAPPPAPVNPTGPLPEAFAPAPVNPQPVYRDPRLYPNQEIAADQPAAAPVNQGDPLLMLLVSIQAPFLNQLRDQLGGDDFADWFIGGFGERAYNDLLTRARSTGLPAHSAILAMLDSFPPIASELAKENKQDVERFVREFCEFDAGAYDAKRGRESADASAA
jgi:hypothetical protein